jgi:hypothetical protein
VSLPPKTSAHPEAFPAVREQGTRPIGDPTKYHMHRTFSAALTLCVDVWSPCTGTSHFVRLRFLSWTRACHVEGRDWRKKKRKHGSRTGQKSAPPLPSLHRDHDVGHRLISLRHVSYQEILTNESCSVPSAISYSARWRMVLRMAKTFSCCQACRNVQHANDRSPELHLPPFGQKVRFACNRLLAYPTVTPVMVGLSESQR